MVETHCWLSTTATGYLDLHMSSPHVIEGEGVEEQCYWEGVAHLEHAAFHPRVQAPRAPKAKRRFIAGFLTLCPAPPRVAELSRGAKQCRSWVAVKRTLGNTRCTRPGPCVHVERTASAIRAFREHGFFVQRGSCAPPVPVLRLANYSGN